MTSTMEYVQIRVNCRSTLGMLAGMLNPQGFSRLFKILKVMQEPLEGISFNFDFICYAV